MIETKIRTLQYCTQNENIAYRKSYISEIQRQKAKLYHILHVKNYYSMHSKKGSSMCIILCINNDGSLYDWIVEN